MTATAYMKNAYLNWVRGVAFPAAPAAIYFGLMSDASTEVTTQIRSAGRIVLTPGAINAFGIVNTNALDFGQSAAASIITVTHLALFDAQSGGNMLEVIALSTPAQVPPGQSIIANAGTVGVKFN